MARDDIGIGDFVYAEMIECEQLHTGLIEVVPCADAVRPDHLSHQGCGGVVNVLEGQAFCLTCMRSLAGDEIV